MKNKIILLVLLSLSLVLSGCQFMIYPLVATDNLEKNSKSLDFYGRVIDQTGEPVSEAKVQGETVLVKGFFQDHVQGKVKYTTTDANGCFKFIGLHGVSLFIHPQKSGYEYSLRLPSSRPADYHPDPKNPVVFTMWKLKGPEPMVHRDTEFGIPCDGTPVRFDLLTGKKNTNGDFVVSLTRYPVDIVRGKQFNWSVQLEIPTGGLKPMEDAYPNEAPADGYAQSITLDFSTNAIRWVNYFDRQFYFKSKNGLVFGRMKIHVTADYQPPPTHASVEIYANPSGSQNLEFDPKKQIR